MSEKPQITNRPIPESANTLLYEDGCLFRGSKRAGSKCGRYRMIGLGKSQYLEHRVIWYLHHGDPGDMMVDHIDGDCFNNRIENLQLVTNKQNQDKSRYSAHDKVQVKNGKRTDYGRQLAREAMRQKRKKQGLHN